MVCDGGSDEVVFSFGMSREVEHGGHVCHVVVHRFVVLDTNDSVGGDNSAGDD